MDNYEGISVDFSFLKDDAKFNDDIREYIRKKSLTIVRKNIDSHIVNLMHLMLSEHTEFIKDGIYDMIVKEIGSDIVVDNISNRVDKLIDLMHREVKQGILNGSM